jgi:hypothetical protein
MVWHQPTSTSSVRNVSEPPDHQQTSHWCGGDQGSNLVTNAFFHAPPLKILLMCFEVVHGMAPAYLNLKQLSSFQYNTYLASPVQFWEWLACNTKQLGHRI